MTIQLHVLNAKGRLDPYLERIERAFARGIETILTKLPVSQVDVVVSAGRWVIPELGMTGDSPSDGAVFVTLDPDNPNLLKDFDNEFMATLGHELHHCMRYGGPGIGTNLGEMLVSEGLACHFELELRGSSVPFYARALAAAELDRLWERAQRELNEAS